MLIIWLPWRPMTNLECHEKKSITRRWSHLDQYKQCRNLIENMGHGPQIGVGHELTHLPMDKMAVILACDIFECIFLYENDGIPIQTSLKYIPRRTIDNKPALDQIMAWRRTGDKPLPGPMMTQF